MKKKIKHIFLFFAVLLLYSASLNGQSLNSFSGNLTGREQKDTIILIGDTQRTGFWERLFLREQNDNARQMAIDEIAKEDPAFLIILGDLVSNGKDKEDWKYFDDVTKEIHARNIPVFAVPGNHDRINKKPGLTNFYNHFPHQNRRTWDSFRFRNLAFILLNSNISRLTTAEVDAQNSWYRQTLDAFQNDSTISAIIVCCHHPPFTNSTIVSDSKDVQYYFAEPFIKNSKTKIFFTGHCHSYEHFLDHGKTFIVTGGGGGPRQELNTNIKTRKHNDLFNGPAIRPFHFCRLIIGENGLRLQMVALDLDKKSWKVEDDFEIMN